MKRAIGSARAKEIAIARVLELRMDMGCRRAYVFRTLRRYRVNVLRRGFGGGISIIIDARTGLILSDDSPATR